MSKLVVGVGSRGQEQLESQISLLIPFPSMLARRFLSTSRSKLTIGLIPADGIGREVIPAAKLAIEALGSSIPKTEFLTLDAGFEHFQKTGKALPKETLE